MGRALGQSVGQAHGGGSTEDFAFVEGAIRAPVHEGHLYLLHTLDSQKDHWALLRIVDARAPKSMMFEWIRVPDPESMRRVLEEGEQKLRTASAWLQVHGQHGGGNPHRAFLDGTKNAYVTVLSDKPLDLRVKERPARGRGAAYVEGGSCTVLHATARGEEDITLYTIDRGRETLSRDELPVRRTIAVRIPVMRDEEKNVYVVGASYTRNDVRLRGRFLPASGARTGPALWNAHDLYRTRHAWITLQKGRDIRRVAAQLKTYDPEAICVRSLRDMAVDREYAQQLDALIAALTE